MGASVFSMWFSAPQWSALLIALFFLLYYNYARRKALRDRYPPGPGGALPIIGNLHQFGTKPHLTFQKWKKQYGPMYFIKMGGENMVVINDVKLLKELISTPAASGRQQNDFWKVSSNNGHGIILPDGRHAEEQRAFAVKTLRELGALKGGKLEGIILAEAKNILNYFSTKVGAPFRVNRVFNGAVVSSLWSVLCGQRAKWMKKDGTTEENEMINLAAEIIRCWNEAMRTGLMILPWLRYLPIGYSAWNKYVSTAKAYHGMLDASVEQHVPTLNNLAPKDFIDHYLSRMSSVTSSSSSFYGKTGRLNLTVSLGDNFMGGSETTSTALVYGVMYLSTHPEIQEKLQREIDRVVGSSRSPTLSDRERLPYGQAVVKEVLRRATVVVAGIRRITEDVTFHGYHLPVDTLIWADISSILRSTEVWGEDADAFRPERFLNEDESEVVHHEAFIPFSVGRRMCIGEPLALDTLFLFVTNIFQKFRVQVIPEGLDIDDVIPGFTLEPRPFEISVSPRNPQET